MATLNPVERRLLYLCEHWARFTADASKRLLMWRVQDNAVRIVQCFFEIQKHQTDYTTGDLFIVFDTPFENSIQYSRELKTSLAGQYEASRADLATEGISADWSFEPSVVPHSAAGFMASLRSFGSHHHSTIAHLVAVLMPSNIDPSAHEAFADWIARALATDLPPRLRLAVVDSLETPRLGKLHAAGHPQVLVDDPQIDALQTAQETFAQEAAVGPGAVFRNHLMGLVTLVEKAPADKVVAKAADAAAFARQHGWVDQEVVVGMLTAGALLKERRFDECLRVYGDTRVAAQKATASGHAAGRQLVMQTWFGEAGARLAAGDPVRAAACYREAATLAHSIPNLVLAIEALRMDAFCSARAGNRDAAIQAGLSAMHVGGRLKPDARGMTTLPMAVLDLLRVLEPNRVSLMEDIKNRLGIRELGTQQTAERQAAALDQSGDVAAFDDVEGQLARQIEIAQQQARGEVSTVMAGADRQFRDVFARGQELLGPSWPMATLAPVAAPAYAA